MSWIDGNYYGDMGTLGDLAGNGRGSGSGDSPSVIGSLFLLLLCVLLLWGMWRKAENDEKKWQTCIQRHTYLWCDDNPGNDGLKSNEDLNIKTMIEESERKGR